jgi:hypothetical protein
VTAQGGYTARIFRHLLAPNRGIILSCANRSSWFSVGFLRCKARTWRTNNQVLYIYTVFGYSESRDLAGGPGCMIPRSPEGCLSQPAKEVFKMNRIQNLFDQIMGIAQIEQGQRDRAREIFSPSWRSLASLETPACWRRSCRVSRRSGQSK